MAVLLAGHGLQLTLLPLKAQALGWTNSSIGLTGSAYYLGFMLGCLTIPRLIRRVGHIRAHAVAVAVATGALLSASLSESYPLWLLLRLLTGWGLASLYTVIESWLNDEVPDENRGTLLAVYTMISLGAMIGGQMLLEIEGLTLHDLFAVGALLLVTAAIPIALTEHRQPGIPAEVKFSWRFVFGASQVGLICAGLSGLVAGLLWSVGVVYVSEYVNDPAAGARFMAAVLLGGLTFQFPVGRLSDRFDRRWAILMLGVLGATASGLWLLAGLLLGDLNQGWLYLLGFLCGAAALPMYSISIAHANDNADGRFLEIASGMLMSNALGAVIGPVVYSGGKALGLADGLMMIIFLAFTAAVVWTALRMRAHTVRRRHFEPYQPLPRTSAEVLAMPLQTEDGAQDEQQGGKP